MENPLNLTMLQLFQFIAILLTGLLAGLFYGYDCSVIKGLRNLDDVAYIQTFQSINNAILNPYFMMSFMGSLFVLPVTCWMSYNNDPSATFYLLLSAALVYFIGVFGTTIFCNVPLNEQIARFSLSTATESEIVSMRKLFEKPWNSYHTIRTVASIVAFGLSILSIFKPKI